MRRRNYDLLCAVERLGPVAMARLGKKAKDVCANVDLYSGFIYRMLGISEDLFTPLFAIGRRAGLVCAQPCGGSDVCQPHHAPCL